MKYFAKYVRFWLHSFFEIDTDTNNGCPRCSTLEDCARLHDKVYGLNP